MNIQEIQVRFYERWNYVPTKEEAQRFVDEPALLNSYFVQQQLVKDGQGTHFIKPAFDETNDGKASKLIHG